MNLSGRIALVTGGNTSIGEWLQHSGARIQVIPEQRLSRDQAKQYLYRHLEQHGRLDILANAEPPHSGSLSGMVLMTQLALPHLRKGGYILNYCTPETLRWTIERFTMPFALALEERGIQVRFILDQDGLDLAEAVFPNTIAIGY